jgi:hypothetical protein
VCVYNIPFEWRAFSSKANVNPESEQSRLRDGSILNFLAFGSLPVNFIDYCHERSYSLWGDVCVNTYMAHIL